MVPTPSESDGGFSMKYVLSAAEQIGAALRKKQAWHLVVLSSTVMPGSTGGTLLPALEAHSGKKCGVDFGLCYNPEFIALGSVIRDMLNPDMILIGESDARSGETSGRAVQGRLRQQSAHPAHELRERRADQALREHLRHHQDLLREHAGAGMRTPAGSGRGCGHLGHWLRYAASARNT